MESRSSESRSVSYHFKKPSSESAMESRTKDYSNQNLTQNKKYNTLEDIDALISKLEKSTETLTPADSQKNKVIEERKNKIVELKELVATARKAEAAQKELEMLQKENNDLDNAINSIKNGPLKR